MRKVILDHAINVLQGLDESSVAMIYIDPPFNTGNTQLLQSKSGGVVYGDALSYADTHEDYIAWLRTHLRHAWRVLRPNGTLYVHLDWREVHHVKVMMDNAFGRERFINEIIWAYDYGARSKRYWPRKHDTILMYVKNPKDYVFNFEDVDRIPYMAPAMQTKERAEAGKTPTDTWWHTIVPTMGYERTGYPTQKPTGILRRMLLASSNVGDCVLDFFAGSGSLGEAAIELNRQFVLVDSNPEAFDVMRQRFSVFARTVEVEYEDRLRVTT